MSLFQEIAKKELDNLEEQLQNLVNEIEELNGQSEKLQKLYDEQGSVQQSLPRLGMRFSVAICLNCLTLRKMWNHILICISVLNFEVFKMGFKWGIAVLLISAQIGILFCKYAKTYI